MPGLNLWFCASGPNSDRVGAFRRAQQLMRHDADYFDEMDFDAGGLLIGHAAYPGYPVAILRDERFLVLVEGAVYGPNAQELEATLTELAGRIFDGVDGVRFARDWVSRTDGDFLIVLARRDGLGVCVLTDSLGRLPVYVSQAGENLWISRESKFIASARQSTAFDRVAWGQALWIGYPLGTRTLFDGIARGGYGSFVLATASDARLRVAQQELTPWRFDEESNVTRVGEAANELVENFGTAIRNRARWDEGRPRVVSLSGGHDSRVVAAGIRRFDGDYTAVSREIEGQQNRDSAVAEVIARALGVPWERIRISSSPREDEERLVWLKDGLNYVGVAFMLEYLRAIVSRKGRRAVYVTGDGGDKAFPDLRPPRPARNEESFIRQVIDDHAPADPGPIEDLVGLNRGSLVDALRRHVAEYPETTWAAKAVRFKISERTRKWLFEGEDRNRCYLWQSSPCYALPVFRSAMRMPAELKRHYRLYREFQRRLWPAMARIEHADSGSSITSLRFRARVRLQAGFGRLSGGAKRFVSRAVRGGGSVRRGVSEGFARRALAQWRATDQLQAVVSERALQAFLATATRYQEQRYWTLALLSSEWRNRTAKGGDGASSTSASRDGPDG